MRTNSRVGVIGRMVRPVRTEERPRQGFAHAATFSGDVMNAPRRPARSLLTPSFIEELESRQLLAVTFSGGVLTINGGGKADNISVKASGGSVIVKVNKAAAQTFT